MSDSTDKHPDTTHAGQLAGGMTQSTALVDVASHGRFWLVGVCALSFDLWSKDWIINHLGPDETRPFINHVINFHRSLNDGAVFGFFKGQVVLFIIASLFAFVFVFYLFASSRCSQWGLHVALGLILAGAIGNLYDRAVEIADVVDYRTTSGQLKRIIGKIVSEPNADPIRIGNYPEGLRPRSFRRADVKISKQGVVRDFIKFVPKFPRWVPKLGGNDVWPWVFNVADAALVCGVGALLCTSWLSRRPRDDE